MEVSVRRREYIDLILNNISDSFDIYHNYWFKDRKFVVYAYNYDKKNTYEKEHVIDGVVVLRHNVLCIHS